MDMMDPLETGQDQKDGECESPEAAAMVAAETCLVVDGDLNIVSEEQEEVPAAAVIQRHQPVVVAAGTKRPRQNRRNVILQQATMENATLVETDPFESVGDTGNTVTYRVVQVSAPGTGSVTDEMDGISQIIHPTTNFTTGATASGVQAVLTSPINGQFYVIGSPQEVFTGTNTRNIAPRNQSETVRGTTRRDERRRATHNEVERRRRDKINSWIMKLGKIIPDCGNEGGKQGQVNFEGQSKGGILAKACEYITELRTLNQRMSENMKENERLVMQLEALRQQNDELRREKLALHTQLTQNGIVPVVEADASAEIVIDQDSLT
ncbi:Hypothetical predicted protein [Cloeon dipterum]|uniref:BHLH domain-containing protein n=2 Tax=Cloeon dipterum TaxID=197152 RepID=A0A8S1DGA4_9INSE|nr:Hypothetical predicted protein [Cloeon dipterum]